MSEHALRQADGKPRHQADTHITIVDPDMFFTILTPGRVKLLRHVHTQGSVASVADLAMQLKRGYASVHKDVVALLDHRLLEKDGTTLSITLPPEL